MPFRVALLLTFVLLAAGCTGDVSLPPVTPVLPTPTLEPFQVFGQTLRGIADRRAKAMLAGDEQGWLAEVDPSGQDVERMRFRNLRQLRPSLVKFFVAAEMLGSKQKVVQMYEYFVIQQNFTATNRIWLDGPLRQFGLNPQRFWTTYRGLAG